MTAIPTDRLVVGDEYAGPDAAEAAVAGLEASVDPTISVADLPVSLLEIELSQPLTPLNAQPVNGVMGKKMRALVRLHHQPIGYVVLAAPHATSEVVAAEIQKQLGSKINKHVIDLRDSPVVALPTIGLSPHQPIDPAELPFITIAIPTHNRPEKVELMLKTLTCLDYPTFEVVVVENGSSDGRTSDVVAQADDDRFRYVHELVAGVSSGRNRGIREARGEIVAFIDDDVIVDEWFLQAIAAGFRRADNVGCVTGLVTPRFLHTPAELYIDQRLAWADHLEPRLFDLDQHRDDSALYPFSAGVFGTGANFAVRKSVFSNIGGFDEALGGSPTVGGEDLDIFLRVILAGYTLVREPAAIVHHEHYNDLEVLRRQMFNYGRGFAAYLTKHLLHPKTGIQILSRIPRGALRILHAKKGAKNLEIVPPDLVGREFRGMMSGTVAYLHSVFALHRAKRSRSRSDVLA